MRLLVLRECSAVTALEDERRRRERDLTSRIIDEATGSMPRLWVGAAFVDVPAVAPAHAAAASRCKSLTEGRMRSEDMHAFSAVVSFGEVAGEAAACFFSTTLDDILWHPTWVGDHVLLGLSNPSARAIRRRDHLWREKVRASLLHLEAMLHRLAAAA